MSMGSQTLYEKSRKFCSQKRAIIYLMGEQPTCFNVIMKRKLSYMIPQSVVICTSVRWNNYQWYLKAFEVIKPCHIPYDHCL